MADTLQSPANATIKKRFTIRLFAVLAGGTFLDGYILGIIGPVTTVMQADPDPIGCARRSARRHDHDRHPHRRTFR